MPNILSCGEGIVKELFKEVSGQSGRPFCDRRVGGGGGHPQQQQTTGIIIYQTCIIGLCGGEGIIINLCVSHGGCNQSETHNPTPRPAHCGSSAPSFTARKRCNKNRVAALPGSFHTCCGSWGVGGGAQAVEWGSHSFSHTHKQSAALFNRQQLNSPIPRGRSPSPAVALRDVLYMRARVCVCVSACG